MAQREECPWWEEYVELRLEGWDWRKAAYMAWAASPARGRWPKSQDELAVSVLGLRSARTIRKWREKQPEMERRVEALQVEPLLRSLRDVNEALIQSAIGQERSAAQDRKTFYQLIGYLRQKQQAEQTPASNEGVNPFAGLSDEELEQAIANLQVALGVRRMDAEEADGDEM